MSIDALRHRLGDAKVSLRESDLASHAGEDYFAPDHPPVAVVFAESVDDIVETLAWSTEAGIAVIPYGAGTSGEGHLAALVEAVSLDLSALDQVHELRAEDFLAVVGPGLTRRTLNERLRLEGLFFPVDPGADASLGGMAATNASGTTTVRYGGMRQNVPALQVALAGGKLVRTGRPVRKTSSGYDLKDLFIGSGGTLGVITELTVRLHPIPEHVASVRASFADVAAAVDAAHAMVAAALPVARLELLDAPAMKAFNLHLGLQLLEQPALWVELHSSTAEAVGAELAEVEGYAAEFGAADVVVARTQAESTELWRIRHDLYWAMRTLLPDRKFTITDTAVPVSTIPAMVDFCERTGKVLGIAVNVGGHISDGNVHSLVAVADGEEELARQYSDAVVKKSLELDGTATGEHGIALAKRRYMRAEHGDSVDLMLGIKQLLDPDGLLNPGKIFED
jgi:D-lactate dehydrogenase (cytochrome)